MRVFLAGATGAIGVPLIGQLVAAGHEVTAITRREEHLPRLRALGVAAAEVCDVLKGERLTEVVAQARPQAVIGQLTNLPKDFSPRAMREAYAANNRVREEGTAALLDAARQAGATRVITQSIAFWYGGGPAAPPAAEDTPLWADLPGVLGESVRAMERADHDTLERGGVVLRYGVFYGPGTWYGADGAIAREVRRRRFPVVGDGAGVTPFVHVQDAAAATVAALEGGESGVYNVVDDEPMPQRDWLGLYARALGAKPPRRVPAFIARLAAGREAIVYVTEMRGAANARAREALDWAPRFPTVREGFAHL